MEKIKYFKYLFIILFIFVIWTFALWKVNNDFKQISDNSGLNIYTNSDKSIYIAKINLERVDIDFWWVLTENIDNKYESNKTKNERFNRISSYDLVKFPENKNILWALNGQFFNANLSTTFLSFPVKSDGKIISSYMDNTLQKRTFIIDVNWIPKILEWFNNWFLENKNNKDVIVWIHPEENFLKDRKLPRNFMWIIDNKNIIFVLAKAKTQENMVKILQNQWIKFENIIMFDWWPSSQMSYIEKWEDKSFIHQVYWGWKVPHFFLIREKR
jgi:hypothetical protein